MVRNDFGNLAEAYHKYRRDYPEKTYSLIYNFEPKKSADVLDVGCGTGIVTNHLSEYYDTVIGVDMADKIIDTAKLYKKGNTAYLVAPAESLPFKDSSVDLITVASSYHWFDYDRVGREFIRVLRPGGKMVVFRPNGTKDTKMYLPNFAVSNLLKYIKNIPSANSEPIDDPIFERVGFEVSDYCIFEFNSIYSEEELLGYIMSHSTYNLLSEKERQDYIQDNRESFKEIAIDGKYNLSSTLEMWFLTKPE